MFHGMTSRGEMMPIMKNPSRSRGKLTFKTARPSNGIVGSGKGGRVFPKPLGGYKPVGKKR